MARDNDYSTSLYFLTFNDVVKNRLADLSKIAVSTQNNINKLDAEIDKVRRYVAKILDTLVGRKFWGLYQFMVDEHDNDYEWMLVHGVVEKYDFKIHIEPDRSIITVSIIMKFDNVDGKPYKRDYYYSMSPLAIFKTKREAEVELKRKHQ